MKQRNTLCLISTSSLLAALAGCSDPSSTSSWVSAGTLAQARSNHTATALSDSSVLIAGGTSGSTMLALGELWNAATGHWVLTESLQIPRMQHAAVSIGDSSILLLGGTNGAALSSVEMFDADTRQFSLLAPMTEARIDPPAIWSKDLEKLLVIGGLGANGPLSSVEAYEPAMNAWSGTTNMSTARAGHTATPIKLKSENDAGPDLPPSVTTYIVVIGGLDATGNTTTAAEVYDVNAGTWTDAGALTEARHNHTATLLSDDSILVVGGQDKAGSSLASAERYQCQLDATAADISCTSKRTKTPLNHARRGHTATLLHNGNVLIVGGEDDRGPLDAVEIYDAKNNEFVDVAPLAFKRTEHTATWQANGNVLVVGGKAATELATAERFVPDDPRIPCAQTTDCPQAMVCNAEKKCEQTSWPLDSESACMYTAERTPVNAGPVGVAFAALLAAWGLRRRRISKRNATAFVAGIILLLPSFSRAQTSTFYLDRLQIAGGSEDGTGVWRPVFGRTGLFGQLAFGYARDPLRVSTFVHDATRAQALDGSAVSLQLAAYATAGFEIAKRGAVQVTLPYVVQQRGYPTENRAVGLEQPVDIVPSALGDLRIDGRMLVAANDRETFALAVRGAMLLPTGDEFSFTGERSAWGNLGLSAEYNADAFFVTANGGLTIRPQSKLVDLSVGSEFVYALAVYVPLRADRVRVGAECWGGIGLSAQNVEALPIEAALAGRFVLGAQRRVFLGVSAGGRLGVGYAPDMRIVARIGGAIPFEKVERVPQLPVRLVPVADTDQDGFVDADDVCPLVKEDNKREEDGCPETDEDRDGIDTAVDACPLVAEDKDTIDDTDGCPEEDADSDGFADIDDKCPKEPGVKNEDPEKLGCPRFIERTKTELKLSKQIEFESNSATITAASFPILDEIAKILQANPEIKELRIEGHTDNVGDAGFNQGLSLRRAEAVRDYLVQRGKVKRSRVTFIGFGASRPIAPNDTEAGRAKNRRVELHIGNAASGEEKKP